MPNKQQTILIREYKDQKAFDQDARKLSKDGWQVQTVTDRPQRAGCGRVLTLWFLAAVIKPKPRLLVTYVRPPQ